jgi:hypothetical protein
MTGRRQLAHKSEPAIKHHTKSPNASSERLKKLAGSIPLKRPPPSPKFIEEQ